MPDRIAVLGGGIAAAACCLRLAALGHTPLWVFPAQEIRDKPGELLSAAARPILSTLGALDLLDAPYHRPSNAMFSAWGGAALVERSGIVHLEGAQTVLNRAAFETDLLARAKESDTDTMIGAVESFSQSRRGWILRTDAGELACAFVIDATGRKAVLARRMSTRFRADRLAVLYGFLSQAPSSDVDPTPATLVEAMPQGWCYATYLADGRLAVNHYTDADLMRSGSERAGTRLDDILADAPLTRRWIDEAGFDTDCRTRIASVATSWVAPCAGRGWLAIGDAAAAFDPLSSHGMTTALWTGIKGAEAALATLKGNDTLAETYAAEVARGVAVFLRDRGRIYGQEQRFAQHAFWRRRHTLPAEPATETV